MTHDNGVENSEENDSKTPNDHDKDVSIPSEKFLFKERVVLVSIVCLSVSNAISFYLQSKSPVEMPVSDTTTYHRLSSSVTPTIGLMFAALVMEVTGRKNMYRYVFALSVLTSILSVASKHPTFMGAIILFRGVVVGASSVMSATAVCEYSSPKHRFTWLIFNKAGFSITSSLLFAIMWDSDILLYILIGIQILLGLICLGITWVWPESPYWLANKGKLEQSREAFLWLRGESGKGELAAVLKAPRRPGPAKLFWISLLVALATMLVSTFSHVQMVESHILTYVFTHGKRESHSSEAYVRFLGIIALAFILATLSYFVRRKLLFIFVSITSFVLCYAEGLYTYISFGSDDFDFGMLYYLLHIASGVLQASGPAMFAEILSIEITPYKYNTCISCICYIVMFLSTTIGMILSSLAFGAPVHPSAFLALYTTFALVAALLYYFFAPETKDKTLLEIQRSYTPDELDSNTEQNQSMMLNVL